MLRLKVRSDLTTKRFDLKVEPDHAFVTPGGRGIFIRVSAMKGGWIDEDDARRLGEWLMRRYDLDPCKADGKDTTAEPFDPKVGDLVRVVGKMPSGATLAVVIEPRNPRDGDYLVTFVDGELAGERAVLAPHEMAPYRPSRRCPRCDAKLHTWESPTLDDPDDAEPHAECTNPGCDYGY